MMRQIKILSKLELINFFNLNVIANTKDKKVRRTGLALAIVVSIVIVIAMSYVGGLCYGFARMGAKELVPAYIVFLSSLFTMLFCAFKSSKIIFKDSCYDILASMPINKAALVISRYVRLYVEGIVVACVVMVPGIVVYVCMAKPSILNIILGILSVVFVPVIPVALSVLLGVIIVGITSNMKYKALGETLVVTALLIGVFALTIIASSGNNVSFDMQAMDSMANDLLSVISGIYPPANWFASALGIGSEIGFFVAIFVSLVLFVMVIGLTIVNFDSINKRLHTSIAKHDYKLGKLYKKSMIKAIVNREAKRYFSSAVYVTNTIIGPIMAVVFSIGLLFIDFEPIFKNFPIVVNINAVMPVLFAGFLTVSTPISSSVSMEGKEFWIIKTLPVLDKDILKGKLMFTCLFLTPFFVVGELIMIIALKPSIFEFIWMLVLPTGIVLYAIVTGLAINLRFPKLNWSSDVEVVKQSASSAIGGFVGILVALVSVALLLLVPARYYHFAACGVATLLAIGIVLVGHKIFKIDLKKIN